MRNSQESATPLRAAFSLANPSAGSDSSTKRPDDAPAYFNKAYALAGARDKAASLDALKQAARVDPAYQPVLDRALRLPGPEDMELLFGEWAESHPQAPPPARRSRYPFTMVAFGVFGGMLLLAAFVQLFRKGR